MKTIKLIVTGSVLFFLSLITNGCYTQFAMRDDYPPRYPDYSETQTDSSGTTINNYYDEGYPHTRFAFSYYYPFGWRTSWSYYDPWYYDMYWDSPWNWYGPGYISYPYWNRGYFGGYNHSHYGNHPYNGGYTYYGNQYRTRNSGSSRGGMVRNYGMTRGVTMSGNNSGLPSVTRTRINSVTAVNGSTFSPGIRTRTPQTDVGRTGTTPADVRSRSTRSTSPSTPNYRSRSGSSSGSPSYTPPNNSGTRSRSGGSSYSPPSRSYSPPSSSGRSSGGSGSRGSSGGGSHSSGSGRSRGR